MAKVKFGARAAGAHHAVEQDAHAPSSGPSTSSPLIITNNAVLTPVARSTLQSLPAGSVSYPGRPLVQVRLPGADAGPWRLVAVRKKALLVGSGVNAGRTVACPLEPLVELPPAPSTVDLAAAALAQAFPGSWISDYAAIDAASGSTAASPPSSTCTAAD